MNITKTFALVLALLPLQLLASDELTIDESHVDFGEQFQFSEVKKDISLSNPSDKTVRLSTSNKEDIKSFSIEPVLLKPHSSAVIHIDIPLLNHLGYFGRRYEIVADAGDGAQQRYPVLVTGFVNSVLDTPNPDVNFGAVDMKATKLQQVVRLASSSAPALSIVKIIDAPEFIDASLGKASNELVLTPKQSNLLGYRKGVVKVATSSKDQSEVWINVLADFHGDFVPDQNPLSFGVQRPSASYPVRLQITSRNSAPFSVEKVTVDPNAHVIAKAAECIPKATVDCHAFLFELEKSRPQGQITGSVTFQFAHSNQVLDVLLEGIFLLDSTKVRSLNDADTTKQSISKNKVDLGAAILNAVNSSSEPELPGKGPLLKWKVANESGIYGYAIFRGDDAAGAFARINPAMVKAKNGGDNAEAGYQYRDITAEPGKTYWYYIAIFYNDGHKQQLTGPQKVTSK
jgi:hypothetical protein